MRRKDRQTKPEVALKVIDQCNYAVLAMADEYGNPYSVPISIVRKGDYIYFHSAMLGKKVECLCTNPNVFLTCVGEISMAEDKFTTYFESANVSGSVTKVLNKDEQRDALYLLCEKHNPTNMENFQKAYDKDKCCTAVWKIKIKEFTGKKLSK